MITPRTTILSLAQLTDFIFRSKQTCFAKTDQKTSLNDQSSMYSHRELPWCYTDHYRGNTVERGTEEVSHNLISVWSMQYRGGYLPSAWGVAEELGKALKHALMMIPPHAPFRGPQSLVFSNDEVPGLTVKGVFEYKNKWGGDVTRFRGEEILLLDGQHIFFHDYMGGIIYDRYYPVELL
jgi:hypothetical protein